ncbi:MAG: alpha/beta hydrolase, partial [Xanthobacteraceae bacterium]
MPDDAMTRRMALGAGAAGLAMGVTQAKAQNSARKTFVLIHGAYHGGWCWRPTAEILESHGHKVYAPSLTGN